jgi:starch synthase
MQLPAAIARARTREAFGRPWTALTQKSSMANFSELAKSHHHKKGEMRVLDNNSFRILFVCAEVFPIVKTGGLADVCAALSQSLARKDIDIRLILPGYPALLDSIRNDIEIIRLNSGGRILRGHLPDRYLPIYLFDYPDLFRRTGGPYQDADGCDWSDNHRRFAAFCDAATTLALHGDDQGWRPDVVHAHDWHAALVPALLSLQQQPRPASVLTIHNLAYQGNFTLDAAAGAGLPEELLHGSAAEFFGQFSFLKAGISTADRLTTVSPTYAREILTPEYGAGLDGVLRTRAKDLVGIMNGVDLDVWSPATDPLLSHRYSARNLSGKHACKAALQHELGLEPAPDVPLVGFVNRLTHQKMADVVLEALPVLAERGMQFVLHGEGEHALESEFAAACGRFATIALRVGYHEDMAHRVIAGADIFLMPSRFEPCGLTALYAMGYGALPVCRKVGGLCDSVVDAGDGAEPVTDATGFSFAEESAAGILASLDRACARFVQQDSWRGIQRTAMERDFGWDTAAERYLALYDELAPGIGFHPHTKRHVA